MHLYHVTYYLNLPDIAKQGLEPVEQHHNAQSALFFTKKAGLPYWFGHISSYAYDAPDATYTPIVLRVDRRDLGTLKRDPIGSRDAGADAYWTNKRVSPDKIEAWTGYAWAPVTDYEDIYTETRETFWDTLQDGGDPTDSVLLP
jgi:hypothetical protein